MLTLVVAWIAGLIGFVLGGYWGGRYTDQAHHTARLLSAELHRVHEAWAADQVEWERRVNAAKQAR